MASTSVSTTTPVCLVAPLVSALPGKAVSRATCRPAVREATAPGCSTDSGCSGSVAATETSRVRGRPALSQPPSSSRISPTAPSRATRAWVRAGSSAHRHSELLPLILGRARDAAGARRLLRQPAVSGVQRLHALPLRGDDRGRGGVHGTCAGAVGEALKIRGDLGVDVLPAEPRGRDHESHGIVGIVGGGGGRAGEEQSTEQQRETQPGERRSAHGGRQILEHAPMLRGGVGEGLCCAAGRCRPSTAPSPEHPLCIKLLTQSSGRSIVSFT